MTAIILDAILAVLALVYVLPLLSQDHQSLAVLFMVALAWFKYRRFIRL